MSSPNNDKQDAKPISPPTLFLGIVKQVLTGDTIVIRDRPVNGPPPERTIVLSNISCGRIARKPTVGNPSGIPEDPFAWEAREFARSLLIGKEVCYSVETELPSGRKYGCVYLGKSTSGDNVALALVEQGLAEVRRLNPTLADKNKVYQQLLAAQEQAKSLGKGRWSSEPALIRSILWSVEDTRAFFEKYKNQPLKAIVENVRDGCSVQAFILPESLQEGPNTFVLLTVAMSGIKSPSIRYEDGKMVAEPWGHDALFFVESRLLQRDITIVIESVFNQNFVGSIIHPNGNIAELLLRQGLARCIDWNLSLVSVPGAADAYRAAEKFAKERRLRLWEDYQPVQATEQQVETVRTIVPGKTFSGIICEVGNGDNVSVKCADGVHKFFLSSIRAPRPQATGKDEEPAPAQRARIRPLYDIPYVFEAREVLRQYIGKPVTVHVDYIQPKTPNTVDERICATVQTENTNLALDLVSKGLASVIRYRNANDSRTAFYADLLGAEEIAQSKGLGMYSKQDPPVHRIADLTGNVAKSRQFLSFLQRAERLDGLVEFVFGASRFRVYIPRETCIITLLLSGIQCPRRGRVGPDGSALPDMPFSNEAYAFAKDLCMQRDVEIRVETIDRVGNFVGWIFLDSPSSSTSNTNGPEVANKSSGKKKKKPTEVVNAKPKTNLSVLLISQGYGTVHRAPATERSPYYQDLMKAEEDAKAARCGLWSSDEFVKEWEAEIKNSDFAAANAADDGNFVPLSGVSEYLDDLSGLQINDDSASKGVNNEATKVSWKAAQVTGISKPPSGSQGLRFFAQHLSDAATLIKISQALNSQSFPSFPPESYPKKGSLCIACFSLDNCWYRARVIRSSPKSIAVQFIDFGNEEVIEAAEYSSRLSPLPSGSLMQLPPQVKEYRLAFVQLPPDAADRTFAERAFCDLVENKEVKLAVQYDSVPCGNESIKPVPAVTLLLPTVDVNSSGSSCPTDLDISESLLSNGLVCVEPIQPQLLKRLPHNLLHKYLDAQASAKKERKNIWRYGDFRADVDQP
ncbi:unnamed protein product [Trichobilharzia szidati]|nr:unnamed protein product [Trichobilharzia szidati]